MASGHPYSSSFVLLPPLKDTGLCGHVRVVAKRTERKTDSSIHQIQIAETHTFLALFLSRDLAIGICGKVDRQAVVPTDDTSD